MSLYTRLHHVLHDIHGLVKLVEEHARVRSSSPLHVHAFNSKVVAIVFFVVSSALFVMVAEPGTSTTSMKTQDERSVKAASDVA